MCQQGQPATRHNQEFHTVKTPNFFFYNTAVVNLPTCQSDASAALAGPMGGALLEGWVVTETVKAFMAMRREPDLYYWRSHHGLEVDLLIVIIGKLHPVEIKLTARPTLGCVFQRSWTLVSA